MSTETGSTNRRDFLAASAAAAVTAASLTPAVHAGGSDEIKVGVIGCGGRGRGALDNVLHAAKGVKVVAIGDAFKDRLEAGKIEAQKSAEKDAVKKLGNSVDLGDRCYVGLDAFEKVIASDANYIILATPPGFRPLHIQATAAAGKNLFTEKPVGVDGTGIRKVLECVEVFAKKGLGVAAGTQRRHQLGYVETMKRIHEGAIGDIVAARCYWNQGILWKNDRQPGQTDLEWQLRNWYNFVWLCGDHIVEQHVHNIDVVNWAMGKHPVNAVGMGHRTRNDPNFGHIFDFFAVDFDYGQGVHAMSMCRQISGCENNVSEALVGTKGMCNPGSYAINGKRILTREQDRASTDPYVQEHTDLIASIRAGKPINELKNVAESTLTAIMGRMSAYTGKLVTWDQAYYSKLDTMPSQLAWDMSLPVPPVPTPGQGKVV